MSTSSGSFFGNSLSDEIVWNNVSHSAHYLHFFSSMQLYRNRSTNALKTYNVQDYLTFFNATNNLPPNFDHGCLSEAEILQNNKQIFVYIFLSNRNSFCETPFASCLLTHLLLLLFY